MKKILLLLILFTACVDANAQWVEYYNGVFTLNSVVIPGLHNALVLGGNFIGDSSQLIYNSPDMVRSWDFDYYSPEPWITGVSFPNEQVGYWCSYDGTTAKSTDGGITWDTLPHAPGNAGGRDFNSVYFLNADTGFCAGGNLSDDSIQTIIKTTDGGNSWIVQLDTFGYWLRSICFLNADTGFVTGDEGVVLQTVDGGNTWNAATLPGNVAERQFNQVYFIKNTDTGFIVGGDDTTETILWSANAGNTWAVLVDTPGKMLNSIGFATASQGYIVGNNGVIFTSANGGISWSFDSIPSYLGENVDLHSVSFYNSHYGIIGGDYGKLLLFLDTTYYTNAYDSTLPASDVNFTGLRLNGKVNPDGKATHVWFEYGTTILLGDTISATPTNISGAGWQPDSATLTGLTPGTSYFYRVVSSDGVDTGYGATLNTATTKPTPPYDSTTYAAIAATNTAILNGVVNAQNNNTTVKFEYGLTPALGDSITATPDPVVGSQNVNVSAKVNGLVYDSTYYFRIVATNIGGTTFGKIVSFTDTISLPIDTTYPANNVTAVSAQMNGIVYVYGDTAVVTFEYGATPIFNNKISATPGTVESPQRVSAIISGLALNTTYYYKVKAINGAGVAFGGTDSFLTSDSYAIDSTLPATNIIAISATLNGIVNASDTDFTVSFEYGTTSLLGDSIAGVPGTVYANTKRNVSAQLTGLDINTQYYYRVKAVNSQNTYYGDIDSFYTNPQTPTDSTYLATNITSHSAQFNGIVNPNGDTTIVTFVYGTNSLSLNKEVNAVPDTLSGFYPQDVSASVTGLDNDTEYYYSVKAVSINGTTYGNVQQFYTGNPEIPNWDFEIWDTTTSPVPVGWHGIGGIAKVPYNNGFAAKLYPAGVMNIGAIVFGGYIDDGFWGGIPVTALPDSVAGYFNYDIAPGDTAYAGFFLERNDSAIAISADTFTGSSNGNFVRMSRPITMPANNLPDTMMFLCLSSNVFSSKQLGNPNSSLTVADLSFIGGNAAAFPSLAFTDWDTLSAIYPEDWPGQGQMYLGLTDILERTTDSYSGKYAVRLNNDISFKNIFHARISESINVHSRHNSFDGYLKWFPAKNDTLSMRVNMYKQGQPVGYGQLFITDSIPSYSPFTCNIYYYVNGHFDSTDVPDSCNIYIAMEDQLPGYAQSVAYLDHLSFDEVTFTGINSNPLSVAGQLSDNFLNVYPNPTNGTLHIEYTNVDPCQNTISIFDVSGRLIYLDQEMVSQTGKITRGLDISDHLPGIYILTVVTGHNSLTGKIVVY